MVWYVCGAINVLLWPFEFCVHGLLSPFQSVHSSWLVPSTSPVGLLRLRKAENPCLLSLQKQLHGNRLLFSRRGILGYQCSVNQPAASWVTLRAEWTLISFLLNSFFETRSLTPL